jgi:site-specific recombinase XerD
VAIFKRGRTYWFHFLWKGQHVQQSTRQGNPNVARTLEAAYRTALAKGEAGIEERKPAPTLKEFSQRFIDAIQVRCEAKPRTVEFYAQQLSRLLEFEGLSTARLDTIDESLIESFVQHRCRQACRRGHNRGKRRAAKPQMPAGVVSPKPQMLVSPASVNRALATLRRLLRLAYEWRVIKRVPKIRLLPGERNREFILSHVQEGLYLEMAPQPLRDFAVLDVDTGLRLGEALALEWPDVHLEPAAGARFGYVHVRDGKSRFARRKVPLTARAREVLASRKADSSVSWVFAEDSGGPMLNSSLDHLHKELRQTLKMTEEFVLHSLRHTYGTRLGEAGADAFTIMRLMGHSSVTVSQRYVHPTPEALERAVERLEGLNQRATKSLPDGRKRGLPATIFATLAEPMSVSH